jgi:hypothetical protein
MAAGGIADKQHACEHRDQHAAALTRFVKKSGSGMRQLLLAAPAVEFVSDIGTPAVAT